MRRFLLYCPNILVAMKRIKEVLKEKGVKQIWLADKLVKAAIF